MSEPLKNPDRDPAADLAEIKRILNKFRKEQRLARLAKGLGKPRTRAETEIWSEGVRKRHGMPCGQAEDDQK